MEFRNFDEFMDTIKAEGQKESCAVAGAEREKHLG